DQGLKLSPFLNPGRPTTSRVFCSDDHSATNNFKPADFLHVHAAVHSRRPVEDMCGMEQKV
ncbi:MAG TPA: hypothetical protein VFE51_26950, partial [Verrucomicrobiae bacterium]|nr:hypothetical protein [Verrucomicrobiae bacterium]